MNKRLTTHAFDVPLCALHLSPVASMQHPAEHQNVDKNRHKKIAQRLRPNAESNLSKQILARY
jgi:hypothetical protein